MKMAFILLSLTLGTAAVIKTVDLMHVATAVMENAAYEARQ